MPHLLGMDHEKFTFKYAGRDFHLTETSETAAKEIIAAIEVTTHFFVIIGMPNNFFARICPPSD